MLRVLFFRDPHDQDTWIAQGVDHDISASGPDVEHARIAFERTVFGYITLAEKHGCAPLSTLSPASDAIWDAWEHVTAKTVEPLPTIPAYMVQSVSHDPLPA